MKRLNGSAERLALILGMAFLASESPTRARADAMVATVQDYVNLIREQRAGVKSLKVNYEATWEYGAGIRESQMMGNGPFEIWEKATFAFSGPMQRCDIESKSIGANGLEMNEARLTTYDGKETRKRERKQLNIQGPRSAYASLNAYTNILKWPVTDSELLEARERKNHNPFLPEMLENGGWEILPQAEMVDGTSCVVIAEKSGTCKLWIDPQKNFALVRYVCKNPYIGLDISLEEQTFSDCIKLSTGIYLPRKIETVTTYSDPKSSKSGIVKCQLVAKEITLGDLPKSLFHIEPFPGETITDAVQGRVYTYTQVNDKSLEENIDRARVTADYVRNMRSRRTFWIVQLVLVTLICLGWASWKFVKRRPSEVDRVVEE